MKEQQKSNFQGNEASDNQLTVFQKAEPRFLELSDGKMKFEAESRFVMQLLAQNKTLAEAAKQSPKSLYSAIINIASIGLTLNPAEKFAYLIPRNVKIADGVWEKRVYFEPSYMGLIKLATDSGIVEWVHSNVVYEKDKFTDNGAGEKPEHRYNAFSKERGKFVGVYCVAKLKSGDYLTTLMPEDEVLSIKARNESVKKGYKCIWDTDFNEMAKKAVVRRAFKMWPRSDGTRFADAVQLSNENEGFELLITSPNIGYSKDEKEHLDYLIEKGDSLGMYAFSKKFDISDASSSGASIWTSLYHSFKKGEKGKYQKIIELLIQQGREKISQYAAQIKDCLDQDDGLGFAEIKEELSQESFNIACEEAEKNYGADPRQIIEFTNMKFDT